MIVAQETSQRNPASLVLLAHASADLSTAAVFLAREARERRGGALVADALRAKRLASIAERLARIVAADLAAQGVAA